MIDSSEQSPSNVSQKRALLRGPKRKQFQSLVRLYRFILYFPIQQRRVGEPKKQQINSTVQSPPPP